MIAFLENQEENEFITQKVKVLKHYRELINQLPIYEAFIKEKPKQVLESLD